VNVGTAGGVAARAVPLATLPLSDGTGVRMPPKAKRGRVYYPAGFAIRVSRVYTTDDDVPSKKVARDKA